MARQRRDEPRFVLARLLLVAVRALLIGLRRADPGVRAAWLSYLVILGPNAGLVRIGNQIAAERYSFVAMFGLVPLLALAVAAGPEAESAGRMPPGENRGRITTWTRPLFHSPTKRR